MFKTAGILGQNYTGPYVSDGKFQTSVAFGKSRPLSETDSYSRLHDTAYALYGPGGNRMAADSLYHGRVENLGAMPSLAGDAVLYGNAGMNSLKNITSSISTGAQLAGLPGAFAGLVYGGVKNMLNLNDYVTNRDQYKKNILAMEKRDPYPNLQLGFQGDVRDSPLLKGTLPKAKESKRSDPKGPTTSSGSGGSGTVVGKPNIAPTKEIDVLSSVSAPTQWLGGGEYTTMVKKTKKQQKQPKQKKRGIVVAKPTVPRQKPAKFGPVATISTAPVAMGNSVSGCATEVVQSGPQSIIVTGRDFMFAPIGTSGVSTWCLVGGTPLTPAAFADTTLANYMRMYAKFRFKRVVAHYITASPTSATGDVMFYYGKDRGSVFLNQTSSQLMGFVMSDPNTVIGPQWTNHSTVLKPTGDWKLTDYGMHTGVEEYADGELFLLQKTASTASPGYVIFDYVIEFAMHQLQPRLLTFPIPRIQWYQVNVGKASHAINTTWLITGEVTGNGLNGQASAMPSGSEAGDVYKVIIDVTNSNPSSWTAVAPSTLVQVKTGSTQNAMTISDGMTCYAMVEVSGGLGSLTFYPTIENAYTATDPLRYGVSATVTWNLQCWISYVGNVSTVGMLPNY